MYKACQRDLGDDPRKLYVGAELDEACVKEAKRLAAEGRGNTPPDKQPVSWWVQSLYVCRHFTMGIVFLGFLKRIGKHDLSTMLMYLLISSLREWQ